MPGLGLKAEIFGLGPGIGLATQGLGLELKTQAVLQNVIFEWLSANFLQKTINHLFLNNFISPEMKSSDR